MKNKENFIKNKFKNDQSLEGIQPDSLWSAIEEGLENSATVSEPQSHSYKAVILGLLLCVTVGGLYIVNSPKNTTVFSNNKLADTHKDVTISNSLIETKNEDLSPQTIEKPKHLAKLESKTSNPKQNGIIKTKAQSTDKTKYIRKISTFRKVKSKVVNDEISQQSISSSHTKTTFEGWEPIKMETNGLGQVVSEDKEHIAPDLIERIDARTEKEIIMDNFRVMKPVLSSAQGLINLSPSLELFVKDEEMILPPYPSFRPTVVDIINPEKLDKWTVGVVAGVNWMHTQFIKGTNDLVNIDELQKSNISRLGSYTSLDVAYQISPKIALVSGLDFNMISYTFDRKTVTQHQKTVERVTYYEVDPATGEHINVQMGEKTISIERTRTVVHQNKFKLVSLPLSLRFSTQKGKIVLGGDAGISYNAFVQQKGRFVDSENTITSFDNAGSSPILPYKKSFLGVHVKPFINYKIKANLGIKLSTSFQYLNNGKSNLVGIDQKSYLMSFSLGLNYHL